jgi:DNA-binding PucR family transcriptional regulator
VAISIPSSETAAEIVRDVSAETLSDIDTLSGAITRRVHAELPELGGDAEAVSVTFTSTHQNLEVLLSRLREGRSMDDVEPPIAATSYTREYARRGVGLPVLLRKYRIGQEEFVRDITDRLLVSTVPAELRLEALVEIQRHTHVYIDRISDGIARIYAEERARWVRSSEAMRSDMVHAVLAGEPVDLSDAQSRLGHALDRPQLAFVVWSDAAESAALRTAMEHAAHELTQRAGTSDVLAIPLGRRLLAGWIGGEAAQVDLAQLQSHALQVAAGSGVRAAIGTAGFGVVGFRSSHLEAMHARRVAGLVERRPGTVTSYEGVALAALMTENPDHAKAFVARELGALAATDDTTSRLAATLRVFLEEGKSPVRTARRLGIHQNTVVYRVKQAAELLGRDPDVRSVETQVALALARVVGCPEPATAA